MSTVKMSVSSIGGLIQAQYGTYQAGADGIVTIDTRDVPSLLARGATFVTTYSRAFSSYPVAPAAATAGRIVASAALSNGALVVANQPDVPRQIDIRVDPGTLGVTAGTVSVVYTGNDGQLTTDSISLVTAASTLLTQFLSKGVMHVANATVANLAGGASPHIQFDTTASLSVPVDPSAVDFAVAKETIESGDETVGTLSTATLGTIAPTTAPNGTHTYGFAYSYSSPNT